MPFPMKLGLGLLVTMTILTVVVLARPESRPWGAWLVPVLWLVAASRPLGRKHAAITGFVTKRFSTFETTESAAILNRTLAAGSVVAFAALLIAAFHTDPVPAKWSFGVGLVLASLSIGTGYKFRSTGAAVGNPMLGATAQEFGIPIALARHAYIYAGLPLVIHAAVRLFGSGQ